jgi:hypothetical protein
MFPVLPLVFVLLLACMSNAAPFVAEKRGIQPELLRQLKLMEQYASAAYCPMNVNSPGDRIKCGSGNCPLVQKAGAESVDEFSRYVSLHFPHTLSATVCHKYVYTVTYPAQPNIDTRAASQPQQT